MQHAMGSEGSHRRGGKLSMNQLHASPYVSFSALNWSSVSGGERNQSLRPWISVFHAEVPIGSLWMPLPERLGPRSSHLDQHRPDVNGQDDWDVMEGLHPSLQRSTYHSGD